MNNIKADQKSASVQEWLQQPSSDICISQANIKWIDELFCDAAQESKFFKTKEDFYLVGFVVALAHKKQPEIWKGLTGDARMISKIVRGWDQGKGDEARELLRKVYGKKPLSNGMDPEVGANKCISSLTDQGLTIIHQKHLDTLGPELKNFKYKWFGIALLLSSGNLFAYQEE
jgi:hypothetical protein